MRKWLEKYFDQPEKDEAFVDRDTSRVTRWGGRILLGGFALFFIWAATAPLDAGVPAPGTVTVAGNRKTIQHLTGGIVDAIEVKDGQIVKKNEVLLRLNPTQAEAQLSTIQAQFIITHAVEARLKAEQLNVEPDFSMLTARFGTDDSRVREAILLQTQLFQSRQNALHNELGILNENLAAAHQQLHGLEQVRNNRKTQQQLLQRELADIRKMAEAGYIPRNRLFDLERQFAQTNATLAEDSAQLGRTQNQIAELKLRILNRRQDFQKEVESQLTEIQRETQSLTDRLSALEFDAANTNLRSPIDGVVVGLRVHTVGGVVRPGEPLLEVVPVDEPLIIQANIPTHLIDKVHTGLQVEIQFPAFNQSKTPNIPGTVQTVGADSLVDANGAPYYPIKVQVTPEGMKLLGSHHIRPGMPANIVVITGERTMLNYLLKPLIDRMNIAFTGD